MELDIFIKGENIDLCIPTREFAENSNWYSWFNNPRITRYLDQGVFPHTATKQALYFESEMKNGNRLLLIISDRIKYVGVISLAYISYLKRRAVISLVIGENIKKTDYSHIIALESIARLTEHAFMKLGLIRIRADQHIQLLPWQQKLELLGYKVEGLNKNTFIKGSEVADTVSLSVLYEDYLLLKEKRGCYWDGGVKMISRIKRLPENSFVSQLQEFYQDKRDEYYQRIFNL